MPLSSVEVYDTLTDRWHPFIGLHRSRGGCLGIYYEGQVLVLGGLHRRTNGGATTAVTLLCAETMQVKESQLAKMVSEREAIEKGAEGRGGVAVAVIDSQRVELAEEDEGVREKGWTGGGEKDVSEGQLDDLEREGDTKDGREVMGGVLNAGRRVDEYDCQGAQLVDKREAVESKHPSSSCVQQEDVSLLADVFPGSCIVQSHSTVHLKIPPVSSEHEEQCATAASVQTTADDSATDNDAEAENGGEEDDQQEGSHDAFITSHGIREEWDSREMETSDSSTSSSSRGEGLPSITAFDSSEESEDEDHPAAVEIKSDGGLDYFLGAGGPLRWEVTEGMWRQVSLPGSLAHMNGSLFCMADIASSLREFDSEEKAWKEVCTMPYPQKGFQLVVLNEGLLLLGVYGGHWLIPQSRSGSKEPRFKLGRKRHMVHWAGLASLHCEAVGWATLTL